MVSRRRLLLTLSAFSLNLRALALQFPRRRKPPMQIHLFPVYIGVSTSKGTGKGIYSSTFDITTGQLSPVALAVETVDPSFFALVGSGNRRVLYVANETSDASSSMSSFLLDPPANKTPAALRPIGKVPSGFPGPCYVSVDSSGHAVFAAEYSGSGISSFRVLPDGSLSEAVERIDFKDHAKFGNHGPNRERQDAPHPHCTTISPDNRFLVVCDLGQDSISVFSIDSATARLSTSEPHLFTCRPGSGPRHVAFHPNGRWLYCINELDSTIDHYLWTTTHAQQSSQALLVVAGTPVKTVGEDFSAAGKNTAAEIAISPNGYYVYASNRGEDSLAVFAIDQGNGSLKLVQRISCGGRTPRQFTLDPTGNWLLCGNQDGDTITSFRRNVATGQLSGPIQSLPVDAPEFILFV